MFSNITDKIKEVEIFEPIVVVEQKENQLEDVQLEGVQLEDVKEVIPPADGLTDEETDAVNRMLASWEAQLSLANAKAQVQALRISIKDARAKQAAWLVCTQNRHHRDHRL